MLSRRIGDPYKTMYEEGISIFKSDWEQVKSQSKFVEKIKQLGEN